HGGGQAAIAFSDEVGELADLLGRVGRGFDLDPAADAIEDRRGIERIGCPHVVSDTASFPDVQSHIADSRLRAPEMMAYSRIRNSQTGADENQRWSGPSRDAICSTSSTIERRILESLMRVDARGSPKPSAFGRHS